MQCAQCQHVNRNAARFCTMCASPFGPICAACGTQNPAGGAFCDHCATPLSVDTAAVGPPRRRRGEAAWRFQTLLLGVMGLLQQQRDRTSLQRARKRLGVCTRLRLD